MIRRVTPVTVLLALALAAGFVWSNPAAGQSSPAPVRTIKDGILDQIRLYVEKPPATTRAAMRLFSATDADVVTGEKKEETRKMQADGPRMLDDRFVARLKELKTFTDGSILDGQAQAPADALIVEGKFTELDPGSRAKRYFVGFGAGKSGVNVEGSVKGADGTLLADFQQRRVGTMGVAGGDSLGKLASDTRAIGEDIAKFLTAWTKGDKLK